MPVKVTVPVPSVETSGTAGPALSCPPLIVTPPLKVLALVRVTALAPVLFNPPLPEIAPLRVKSLAPESVKLVARLMALETV